MDTNTLRLMSAQKSRSQEIKKAVRRAAPNKAPGTDDIPNAILHQTLDILLSESSL